MNVVIRNIKEVEHTCDALILPLCEGEKAELYREIDSSLRGLIGNVISSGEFGGRQNQVALIHSAGMIKPQKVLLVGLGKKTEASGERLRQAGGKALSYLSSVGCRDVSLAARYIISLKQSPVPFLEGGLLSLYRYRRYKKDEETPGRLRRFTLIGKSSKTLLDSIQWVLATTAAVDYARDLVNTPANDMTPAVLARTARSLAGGKVTVRVLGRRDAEREGMEAYLSVARGSAEQPKFIILKYNGGKGRPIAIIGKSITFDSGGISLKPSEGMEKMKYDMAGGAVVLAVIRTASRMRLPVNLIGLLPATENLPSGSASKPGDIVTSITGKTVEIVNTDAEGRLALADAMGYVKKYRPAAIIDVATLTGACSVALGNEAIAMMGNDSALMERLKHIGDEIYERVWQMPLYEEYLDYIKSDIADLKNSGGKTGSLVTAGYFLKEFAGDTPWVHLDIAGTAWAEKDKPYLAKGATGVGVRLLLNLLKETK